MAPQSCLFEVTKKGEYGRTENFEVEYTYVIKKTINTADMATGVSQE